MCPTADWLVCWRSGRVLTADCVGRTALSSSHRRNSRQLSATAFLPEALLNLSDRQQCPVGGDVATVDRIDELPGPADLGHGHREPPRLDAAAVSHPLGQPGDRAFRVEVGVARRRAGFGGCHITNRCTQRRIAITGEEVSWGEFCQGAGEAAHATAAR